MLVFFVYINFYFLFLLFYSFYFHGIFYGSCGLMQIKMMMIILYYMILYDYNILYYDYTYDYTTGDIVRNDAIRLSVSPEQKLKKLQIWRKCQSSHVVCVFFVQKGQRSR